MKQIQGIPPQKLLILIEPFNINPPFGNYNTLLTYRYVFSR